MEQWNSVLKLLLKESQKVVLSLNNEFEKL